MRRPVLAAALLLGLALAARLEAAGPVLERSAEGVALTRLPPMLRQEDVRRHLGTGLTTTLAFEVRLTGGGKARGAARIDIRYELWDEIWLVTRADTSGRTQRARFPSFDQLDAWWRDLRLELPPRPHLPRPGRGAAAGHPLLPVRAARRPALVLPQPGRALRRQRRGRLRSPGGALGRPLQPAARHFHRPAGAAGVRVEAFRPGAKR